MFVLTSSDPISSRDSFAKDGEDFVHFFPDVSQEKIQTFGQGNLVCTHVIADRSIKGSLCFIGVYDDESFAELYEFWSNAKPEV